MDVSGVGIGFSVILPQLIEKELIKHIMENKPLIYKIMWNKY